MQAALDRIGQQDEESHLVSAGPANPGDASAAASETETDGEVDDDVGESEDRLNTESPSQTTALRGHERGARSRHSLRQSQEEREQQRLDQVLHGLHSGVPLVNTRFMELSASGQQLVLDSIQQAKAQERASRKATAAVGISSGTSASRPSQAATSTTSLPQQSASLRTPIPQVSLSSDRSSRSHRRREAPPEEVKYPTRDLDSPSSPSDSPSDSDDSDISSSGTSSSSSDASDSSRGRRRRGRDRRERSHHKHRDSAERRSAKMVRKFLTKKGVATAKLPVLPELVNSMGGMMAMTWWRSTTLPMLSGDNGRQDDRSINEGLAWAMCLEANNIDIIREIAARRLIGLQGVLSSSLPNKGTAWEHADALLPLSSKALRSLSLGLQKLVVKEVKRSGRQSTSLSLTGPVPGVRYTTPREYNRRGGGGQVRAGSGGNYRFGGRDTHRASASISNNTSDRRHSTPRSGAPSTAASESAAVGGTGAARS